MDISSRSGELADAAGGRSAHTGPARTALAFLRDSRAATAIEYGLVAGLIAMVVVTAIDLVGSNLNNEYFNKISGSLP